jgi:CoA enzyme activase uncharacterised domain (DUF2229)
VKIGLPDTLRYQRYGAWWEAFLTNLGLEVIKPSLPLEDSLSEGARLMPSEPVTVQLFVGRVLELAPLVDAIVVPDLNPGAEPGMGQAVDPWMVDLASMLSRRFSLPALHSIPTRLDPTETSSFAVRLGVAMMQNTTLVRRSMDRMQTGLKPAKPSEPVWAKAGLTSIGLVGDPSLLETDFLLKDFIALLEQHGLHAVNASEMPREKVLEFGRKKLPDALETDVEAVGGAAFLEGKAQILGLIALAPANAPLQTKLGKDIVKRARKPSVQLELGAVDLETKVAVFAGLLGK